MIENLVEPKFEEESLVISRFVSQQKKRNEYDGQSYDKFAKISIIMPSFNQAEYLERSILSVLNQNYPNIELIVIDGGSTDGSIEIIKKYESYLAYWHSGSDSGQSDALNHGFSKATGDIYGWLNSDDLYTPGAISIAVENLMQFSQRSIVFGDWYSIDAHDDITSYHYAFDFNVWHFLYEGFTLNAQSMFWRKSVHQKFGQFNENLHRTMDYDMILRFGLNEGNAAFKRVSVPLGCFRRHEDQKTQAFDAKVFAEHQEIARKNNLEIKYSILGKLLRLVYRVRRMHWYIRRGGIGYCLMKIYVIDGAND